MSNSMQLKITHTTEHTYDKPIRFGLKHLRMTPKSRDGQRVLDWTITITGGQAEAEFEDQHNNHVTLVGFPVGAEQITIVGAGTVEVEDRSGVVGVHGGYAPLWYFDRITPLTRAGPEVRRLARDVGGTGDLDCLHALSAKISEIVTYTIGETGVETTAEDALKAGVGVCQDHAHVFISAARLMGRPARYVSGYLLMDDRIEQQATHAWAEAFVEGIGWIGFDPSNGISPDARYVRIATGLDFKEAAPLSGVTYGDANESLSTTLTVQQ